MIKFGIVNIWPLKAGACLIQVVAHKGLIVFKKYMPVDVVF